MTETAVKCPYGCTLQDKVTCEHGWTFHLLDPDKASERDRAEAKRLAPYILKEFQRMGVSANRW